MALLSPLHAADVANLRCENQENPSGIDVTQPRLSWVIKEEGQQPEARGQKQMAYQVLVASSEELLDKGDLWDSGKVMSDQSIAVRYDGKPLVSENRYWWHQRQPLVGRWTARVWTAHALFALRKGGDK